MRGAEGTQIAFLGSLAVGFLNKRTLVMTEFGKPVALTFGAGICQDLHS